MSFTDTCLSCAPFSLLLQVSPPVVDSTTPKFPSPTPTTCASFVGSRKKSENCVVGGFKFCQDPAAHRRRPPAARPTKYRPSPSYSAICGSVAGPPVEISFQVTPPSVVRKNFPPVDAMASDEKPPARVDFGLNATPLQPAVSPSKATDAGTPLAKAHVLPPSF